MVSAASEPLEPARRSDQIRLLPHGEKYWTPFMAAAVVALAGGLLYDFWTPSVFLAGYDTYTHDYLMWEWGWRSLFAHGHVPLWNPYLFGGFPFVASFAFCPFYPPAWLSVAFPTSLAITSQYALHFAVGGFGFYLFSRAMRTRREAAALAGLLYMCGAHVPSLVYPGHLAKVQAIAWMPWAMAGGVMLLRRGGVRWGLALGAAWAMQLLASHLQIFYATFWLVILFVISGSIANRFRKTSENRHIGKAAFGLAGAVAFAGCLSAIQMFPGLEMARQSNRGEGLDQATAAFGALPADEMAEMVLPSFRGDSTGRLSVRGVTLPYVGSWHADASGKGSERLVSDYAGVWPVLFAVVGLVFSSHKKKWFFLAMGLTALLVAIGDATPLFGWMFRWGPGFSRFRSPATFQIVAHFSLFALAALGLHAAMERIEAARPRVRTTLIACLLLIVAVAGGAYLMANARILSSTSLLEVNPLMTHILLGEEDFRGLLMWRAVRHVAAFLGLGCALLGWVIRVWPAGVGGVEKKELRVLKTLPLLLFLLCALADGFLQVRHFFPKNPTEGLNRYYSSHWIESAILRDAGDATLPMNLEIGRGGELNNRGMMRGVRSAHGYHPIVYAAYEKLLRAVGGLGAEALARHFAQNYRLVDGTGSPPEGWRAIDERGGRSLISREKPIPFARIPRRIEPLGQGTWDALDLEAWAARIGSSDFDPSATTICEGNYEWRLPEAAIEERHGASPDVDVAMTRPGAFRLRLTKEGLRIGAGPIPGQEQERLENARLIPCLLPIPAAKGWRVKFESENRRRTESATSGEWLAAWPRRANGFFLLAPLSTDPSTVTVLEYRPVSYTLGKIITLLTLLALCAWFVSSIVYPRLRKSASAR